MALLSSSSWCCCRCFIDHRFPACIFLNIFLNLCCHNFCSMSNFKMFCPRASKKSSTFCWWGTQCALWEWWMCVFAPCLMACVHSIAKACLVRGRWLPCLLSSYSWGGGKGKGTQSCGRASLALLQDPFLSWTESRDKLAVLHWQVRLLQWHEYVSKQRVKSDAKKIVHF